MFEISLDIFPLAGQRWGLVSRPTAGNEDGQTENAVPPHVMCSASRFPGTVWRPATTSGSPMFDGNSGLFAHHFSASPRFPVWSGRYSSHAVVTCVLAD